MAHQGGDNLFTSGYGSAAAAEFRSTFQSSMHQVNDALRAAGQGGYFGGSPDSPTRGDMAAQTPGGQGGPMQFHIQTMNSISTMPSIDEHNLGTLGNLMTNGQGNGGSPGGRGGPGSSAFAYGSSTAAGGGGGGYGSALGPSGSTATTTLGIGNESLRLKAEQLRMLQDQNAHLLANYEQLEARSNATQSRNVELEREVRELRHQVMELSTLQRTDVSSKQKLSSELEEREAQLRVIADQNRELMRLLARNEERAREADAKAAALQAEAENLRQTMHSVQQALAAAEERSSILGREAAMRAQELQVCRAELDQLRASSNEAARRSGVEIEALQEALRVRKEKQYSLLEKVNAAEENLRKAREDAAVLAEALRVSNVKAADLESRIHTEERSRQAQTETAKSALQEADGVRQSLIDTRAKLDAAENDKVKLESELRTAGDHVREMAQKVFAVLERLKLSELGKTKAIEALKARDHEISLLKKRVERVSKEAVKEGRQAASLEAEIKGLTEEVTALRETNVALTARCRDETRQRLKEHEGRVAAEEKVNTLQGRLALLLQKLQTEEEAAVSAKEDVRSLEAQVAALTTQAQEADKAVESERDNVRLLTAALRDKREEADKLQIRVDGLVKKIRAGAIKHAGAGLGGTGDGADIDLDGLGGAPYDAPSDDDLLEELGMNGPRPKDTGDDGEALLGLGTANTFALDDSTGGSGGAGEHKMEKTNASGAPSGSVFSSNILTLYGTGVEKEQPRAARAGRPRGGGGKDDKGAKTPGAKGGDNQQGGATPAAPQGRTAREREVLAERVEPDNDTVRSQGGRGRFYLYTKPNQGLILIKGERRTAKALLRRLALNDFLKKAQMSKAAVCREALVTKMCHIMGLALVEEEERIAFKSRSEVLEVQLAAVGRINDALGMRIEVEEHARRQIVVGYARAVKAQAITQQALSTSLAAITRLSAQGSATSAAVAASYTGSSSALANALAAVGMGGGGGGGDGAPATVRKKRIIRRRRVLRGAEAASALQDAGITDSALDASGLNRSGLLGESGLNASGVSLGMSLGGANSNNAGLTLDNLALPDDLDTSGTSALTSGGGGAGGGGVLVEELLEETEEAGGDSSLLNGPPSPDRDGGISSMLPSLSGLLPSHLSQSAALGFSRPPPAAIRLNECSLGDEEIHALVAVLRDENTEAVSMPMHPHSNAGVNGTAEGGMVGSMDRVTALAQEIGGSANGGVGGSVRQALLGSSSASSHYGSGITNVTGMSVVGELHLAKNHITDAGARSIATMLSHRQCSLRFVDLRGNHITMDGLRRLAEALERNDNVTAVNVHASGKIEAVLSPMSMAVTSAVAAASSMLPGSAGNGGGAVGSGAAAARGKGSLSASGLQQPPSPRGGPGSSSLIGSSNANMPSETIVVDVRDQTPPPPTNPLLHVSEVVPAGSAAMKNATASLKTAAAAVTGGKKGGSPGKRPGTASGGNGNSAAFNMMQAKDALANVTSILGRYPQMTKNIPLEAPTAPGAGNAAAAAFPGIPAPGEQAAQQQQQAQAAQQQMAALAAAQQQMATMAAAAGMGMPMMGMGMMPMLGMGMGMGMQSPAAGGGVGGSSGGGGSASDLMAQQMMAMQQQQMQLMLMNQQHQQAGAAAGTGNLSGAAQAAMAATAQWVNASRENVREQQNLLLMSPPPASASAASAAPTGAAAAVPSASLRGNKDDNSGRPAPGTSKKPHPGSASASKGPRGAAATSLPIPSGPTGFSGMLDDNVAGGGASGSAARASSAKGAPASAAKTPGMRAGRTRSRSNSISSASVGSANNNNYQGGAGADGDIISAAEAADVATMLRDAGWSSGGQGQDSSTGNNAGGAAQRSATAPSPRHGVTMASGGIPLSSLAASAATSMDAVSGALGNDFVAPSAPMMSSTSVGKNAAAAATGGGGAGTKAGAKGNASSKTGAAATPKAAAAAGAGGGGAAGAAATSGAAPANSRFAAVSAPLAASLRTTLPSDHAAPRGAGGSKIGGGGSSEATSAPAAASYGSSSSSSSKPAQSTSDMLSAVGAAISGFDAAQAGAGSGAAERERERERENAVGTINVPSSPLRVGGGAPGDSSSSFSAFSSFQTPGGGGGGVGGMMSPLFGQQIPGSASGSSNGGDGGGGGGRRDRLSLALPPL